MYGQCSITASNVTTCVSQGPFPVQASATQFTTYVWSTSGTGTFAASTSLFAVYSPSTADNAAGSVTLTVTASGGSCTPQTATVLVTINPLPSVNAGVDQTSCANPTLSAVASGGGTLFNWTSSGTGTFSSTTSPTSVYTPSPADRTTGSVTLTATAISLAGCAVSDQMKITLLPPATANAGFDLTSCSNTAVTLSSAAVANATNYNWSTSGTGTFSSITQLNPVYQPSAADITSGSVTLTLTAASSGGCTALDNLLLTIVNTGTVTAGPDQSLCANSVQLNAVHTGPGGILWSTTGSGTFSNTSLANPTYTPSQADRTAGSVVLTATANNGACTASDQLTVTINARVRLLIG